MAFICTKYLQILRWLWLQMRATQEVCDNWSCDWCSGCTRAVSGWVESGSAEVHARATRVGPAPGGFAVLGRCWSPFQWRSMREGCETLYVCLPEKEREPEYTCTHVCMCVCTHTHERAWVRIYVCVCICMRERTCLCTMCECACVCVCMCVGERLERARCGERQFWFFKRIKSLCRLFPRPGRSMPTPREKLRAWNTASAKRGMWWRQLLKIEKLQTLYLRLPSMSWLKSSWYAWFFW